MCLGVTSNGAQIKKYETESVMTKGVTLKNIQKFYSDYSLNINCVTADLSQENLSLELLKNGGGCDKTATTFNLANTEKGVVAATNADFFSSYKGTQNFSLGIEIKDGKLLQSHINADMAAGLFDGSSLLLSYIDFSASVTAQNGEVLTVTHINKPTDYYGALLMYTADFNGGESPYLPEGITAVTVENGEVTSKGVSMGGTITIPKNGYILVINDTMTPMLDMNMNVGETASLTVTGSPSTEGIKTAFGGGTLLLKEGQKTPVTHTVNGNNPRTAIGTNADGSIVYLITVDGRQQISRGVTLSELADICLELGCVNAMNLDGGGSTAMVGKTLENNTLHTINSPSENRKVINAVAVVSNAEPGAAVGVYAKSEKSFVLEGDTSEISLVFFDENQNPASSAKDAVWKVLSGDGEIRKNVFYAGSEDTVLELYYNNTLQQPLEIPVIKKEEVCGINTQSTYNVKSGDTLSLSQITVFDKNGNTASVSDISLLNPKYDTSFLRLDKMKAQILRDGAGELSLSCGKALKCIKLICSGYRLDVTESITDDEKNGTLEGSVEFNILANAKNQTLLDRLVYARAVDSFRKNSMSAVIGGGIIPSLTYDGQNLVTAESYGEYSYGGAKIITAALTSSGSLRKESQWDKLANALSTCEENSVILLFDSEVNLTDSLEARVFEDTLSEAAQKKNVFVVYSGENNGVVIKNGVRYISLCDTTSFAGVGSALERVKYVSFYIKNGEIAYTFKNLYGGMILE